MKEALVPIVSLLIASSILLTGNGLQGTLIALRANLEGFPVTTIGLLMSAYYLGFVLGCYINPVFVKRVGHIRTFAALASVASSAAILHAMVVEPAFWLLLRVMVGFCFAGLSMVTESWINERASNVNRGRVLSIYRMVDLASMTMGQVMLTLADPAGFTLFCIVSVLVSLALVPVSLTTAVAPRPIESARLNLVKVFGISPLAAWGACSAGLSNGAFWALAPVFIQNLGFATHSVAAFMSTVIVAGALAQFPVGMLSDRFDRRRVLIGLALVGCLSALGLARVAGLGMSALLAGGFIFGLTALCHYSMAVAHANDHAAAEDFVEVASSLLFLFGVGATVGPVLAALCVQIFGNPALFLYIGTIQGLSFAFGLYRLARRPGVPLDQQESYVLLPRTTPGVFELDPRSETEEDGGHAQAEPSQPEPSPTESGQRQAGATN